MTNVQTGSIRLGIGKQTALGTIATQPTYLYGVESGGIVVPLAQEPDDLTSGKRSSSSVRRGDVSNSADQVGRAFLASIGLLLYGALGDVDTTGASAPYTHVFTLADTLPYLSVFQEFGAGGSLVALRDCKIDELTFEWEGNQPLKVSAKYNGTVVSFPTSITAGTDETGLTTYFTPVGGTFTLDVDSATPATAAIKGGKITLTNATRHEHYSGAIQAGDVSEGWHVAECAFTTVPADLATWKTIVTGTSTGTGVAASPVYGCFAHTFVSGAYSLKAEGTKVAYVCDLPQAAAGGGAAEVELAGKCMLPIDDSAPVKFTLINATASY